MLFNQWSQVSSFGARKPQEYSIIFVGRTAFFQQKYAFDNFGRPAQLFLRHGYSQLLGMDGMAKAKQAGMHVVETTGAIGERTQKKRD